MNELEQSRRLHSRVREFAHAALQADGNGALLDVRRPPEVTRHFEKLACDVFEFQTGERVHSRRALLSKAVPTDSFRFGGVFRFAASEARQRFVTSGTTGANTGVHYLRELETYEELSSLWGARGLGLSPSSPRVVAALAPWTGRDTRSSLGYMMQRFMERFDGRGLAAAGHAGDFVLHDPARWLIQGSRINLDALRTLCDVTRSRSETLVLLATSFALVELLDAAGDEVFELPSGSVVMPTGGFKGRTRTIDAATMASELRRMFGDVDIVGEYGMTELTSQLYEGTLRSGTASAAQGVYFPPPWLEVHALDPASLEPLEPGAVGLACFIDLGNVDSAVCILTQDLIRAEGHGIRLLGRQPKAPLRGCSLAVEALFRAAEGKEPGETSGAPPIGGSSVVAPASTAELGPVGERIAELLRGARRVVAQVQEAEEVAGALASSCGLSVQGVFLGLERALEAEATDGDVSALVDVARRAYGPLRGAAWVLLSSNVFTAPLRAIALALAVCEHVYVRPSRRDPVFTRLLHDAVPGAFTIVDRLEPLAGDVVFAYGSDETLATVASSLPSEVRLFGHGHGMGVAVIGAGADLIEAAVRLALDLTLFDQAGCLSPRLVLIDCANDVQRFALQLAGELTAWEQRVPVGPAGPAALHQRVWERRVSARVASLTDAGSGWVAQFDEAWAARNNVPLSTTPRTISVVAARDVVARAVSLGKVVTTVGVHGSAALSAALRRELPGVRVTALGRMQTPPLDGPVDRRHL